MTFEAFWNLLQWIFLPLAGAIAWWVRQIDEEHVAMAAKLEQRIETCYANHVADMGRMKNDLGDFKLAVVGNYVSKAELERTLDRIESAISRLGDRVESLMGG